IAGHPYATPSASVTSRENGAQCSYRSAARTKAAMVDAGTKYLAISFWVPFLSVWLIVIFALIIPSKHFFSASNTPDPEFPVVGTSLITVGGFLRKLGGSSDGDIIRE